MLYGYIFLHIHAYQVYNNVPGHIFLCLFLGIPDINNIRVYIEAHVLFKGGRMPYDECMLHVCVVLALNRSFYYTHNYCTSSCTQPVSVLTPYPSETSYKYMLLFSFKPQIKESVATRHTSHNRQRCWSPRKIRKTITKNRSMTIYHPKTRDEEEVHVYLAYEMISERAIHIDHNLGCA